VPNPENGNLHVLVRRRRTRQYRRNRRIQRWLAFVLVAFFTAGVSALALKYFSPSLFRARQSSALNVEQVQLNRDGSATLDQIVSQQPARPVYPYSVVPGGVQDAKELKWVAEHDPVVAAHYAGFDYDRAQVVRVTLARTVYVSYRIGNHIYWTRRRLSLHKGEKLITDGKMTARTRCANRIEEEPQQEAASPAEPAPERFDEPMRAGSGTAMQSPPVAFESSLLNRPAIPGVGPAAPLSLYDPLAGGSFLTISPPPLPTGLCSPTKKNGSTSTENTGGSNGNQKKVGPCAVSGGTPATVPEPGTWILFASGLAAIYWQARRRFARA
jgi:hypothetical protein